MNFECLMQIQSALNDFTLKEKHVFTINAGVVGVLPELTQAKMSLAKRSGEFLRHQSGLVKMCDMYQWAGNREFLELQECFPKNKKRKENFRENACLEVVDVMHFDLSLLVLTCTKQKEMEDFLEKNKGKTFKLNTVEKVRNETNDLQLTKWWTSNKISVETIREKAIAQFGTLLLFASQTLFSPDNKPLFSSLEEIVETYKKKVEVNYERVRQNYDHIVNAEMGNEKLLEKENKNGR